MNCRHTHLPCTRDGSCETCDIERSLSDVSRYGDGLVRDGGPHVRIPNPCPYVKFVTPDGSPGIEIGIKGTF